MKQKVIIRRCEEYDSRRIERLVLEAIDELGVSPRGRTMIKPNCVISHPRYFPHAFTRPEFLDGLICALKQRSTNVTELSIGERSGITVPTRYCFAQAGYNPVLKKHALKIHYFDEMPQVRKNLTRPGSLRDFIFVPKAVMDCDFLVNAPKFKAHPWTKVTFALKNYIGIQDDRHRLIDHDHMLSTKVADLQEVIEPKLIAIDAIIAGEVAMLTPEPFPLGLVIFGVNPVAVDSVCTWIAGLNPKDVDHIRICNERGIGPISLDEIEVNGDVTLEEAKDKAKGFKLTLERVEGIFNGKSSLTTYAGPPPDPDKYDYCWGGCPGALYEAMQVIKVVQPDVYNSVKPIRLVFGSYEGKIEVNDGERVLFMGDCSKYKGTIDGKDLQVPSLYTSREKRDPNKAKSSDLIVKMIKFFINRFRNAGRRVVRVRGCPVSVAENILYLSGLGNTKNPYFDPDIVFKFGWHYTVSMLVKIWKLKVVRVFA